MTKSLEQLCNHGTIHKLQCHCTCGYNWGFNKIFKTIITVLRLRIRSGVEYYAVQVVVQRAELQYEHQYDHFNIRANICCIWLLSHAKIAQLGVADYER